LTVAKRGTVFVCRECGNESPRWAGQCPSCGTWNSLEEVQVVTGSRRTATGTQASAPARAIALTEVELDSVPRRQLAWDELNRVLGGGVVPGSLVLLGGEPGVGKSTLLLHLAVQAAASGGRVLYASGEESAQQVAMRARRLGTVDPGVLLLAETDLDLILGAVERETPSVLIVDSIQTVFDPAVEAAAGSVSQVRESAGRLMRLAKQSGIPVFLIGHVTKEGAIAGPRVLEHMVDTVLYLEGERQQEFRILRATKNRFGSAEEIGIFAMGEGGLEEVTDPSAALLGDLRAVPGTAVLAAIEGTRPLLVEIQSLVPSSGMAMPRRSATGVDLSRLHMILAILEKRAGIGLASYEVFVNVAGGVRVVEPAADLALALSVAGSRRNSALPERTVVIGELGLTGEVRRVGQMERRLQEAVRRGFEQAIVPAASPRLPGLRCIEVQDIRQAIAAAQLRVQPDPADPSPARR
jgi:DNA repair protein RadA/Sms